MLVNDRVLSLLRDRRIFTTRSNAHRLKVGDLLAVRPGALIEAYSHILAGTSLPMAMGSFSYSYSPLSFLTTVGRYCSIAKDVTVMGDSHPVDRFTTSPFTYGGRGGMPGLQASLADHGLSEIDLEPFDKGFAGVSIGNDVWIGQSVLFARGVMVGDGAIVGARSVVTRNVEPYSIVVGTPARIVRYRFDPDIIQSLLRLKWWRYHFANLPAVPPNDVGAFVTALEEQIVAKTVAPFCPPPLTGRELIDAAEHSFQRSEMEQGLVG